MEIKARRTAFLPGERVELQAMAGVPDEVRWSGGGTPASGEGSRFRTTFVKGGTYSIRAQCREGSIDLGIEVAQVDAWLVHAADFFGPSLDIGDVTVKTSRWVLGPAGTAWTCNTVVRFKRPIRAEDLPRPRRVQVAAEGGSMRRLIWRFREWRRLRRFLRGGDPHSHWVRIGWLHWVRERHQHCDPDYGPVPSER